MTGGRRHEHQSPTTSLCHKNPKYFRATVRALHTKNETRANDDGACGVSGDDANSRACRI